MKANFGSCCFDKNRLKRERKKETEIERETKDLLFRCAIERINPINPIVVIPVFVNLVQVVYLLKTI